ncbi:glycoside hydrolase family 18 protein, partial [Cercospora zeae-maydis SCOH1-5]
NSGGLKSMIYYPNRAVYARKFFPSNITGVERFSHIFSAFANVSPDGTVTLDDPYADLEISNGVSASKGAINQLQELKKANSDLKLILSIGGYTYSPNFAAPASTPGGRERFARSAVELVKTHDFDGIDVDWEYPEDQAQGENFYQLLAATREELDAADGNTKLLTTAVSVNPQLPIEKMDKILDYWLLMEYDYSGAFDKVAGHTANVHASADKQVTPFDTDSAVQAYKQRGVRSSKLILGMPLYGHDFVGTEGPSKSFSSVSDGSWGTGDDDPTGVWDYKAIADTEPSKLKLDRDLIASWSYDSNTRTMVSYDTPEAASLKAKYILETDLAGAMWWDITGD